MSCVSQGFKRVLQQILPIGLGVEGVANGVAQDVESQNQDNEGYSGDE
jgi:hypothetical protein